MKGDIVSRVVEYISKEIVENAEEVEVTVVEEGPDEVTVEWGIEEHFSALAITDNRGLLTPDNVWNSLFRQTSLEGLLDTSGRGIYLMYLHSHELLLTVAPGRRTPVVVLFGSSENLE